MFLQDPRDFGSFELKFTEKLLEIVREIIFFLKYTKLCTLKVVLKFCKLVPKKYTFELTGLKKFTWSLEFTILTISESEVYIFEA